MLPLLRDGHVVVGLDRAPAMLARAAARIARAGAARRARAARARGSARAALQRRRFPSRWRRSTASSTCESDGDLAALLPGRGRRAPAGWLAGVRRLRADTPLSRSATRTGAGARTRFRDPAERPPTIYTGPRPRRRRRAAHDVPLCARRRARRSARPRARTRLLRHRLLHPAKSKHCSSRAGLALSPAGEASTAARSTRTTSAANSTSIWHASRTQASHAPETKRHEATRSDTTRRVGSK